MPFYTDPVTKMEHKFACNHCIRGHRSTNCSHNDRPLFYIRKKGRPVSQCTQCRALRKNRSLHTRCECANRVQIKGLGGSIELADLPRGMTQESAKEFVDRLSMDQGGCRNCNSNRCQCDRQNSQSIAPASASASPATPLSMGGSSPYSLGFSSSASPSQQVRSGIYSLNSTSYATMPQFIGMPTFTMFPQSHQSPSQTMNPAIAAHVQQYHQRQEQLRASTQRRLQEAAEIHRRNTDAENLLGSMHQPSVGDPYHRASLPINFESSVHHDPTSRPTEHHINIQQPSCRETRQHEQIPTSSYTYTPEIALGHIPYAASLTAHLFRPPSVTEMDIRRQAVQPMVQPSRDIHQDLPKQDSFVTVKEASDLSNSSRSSLSLERADSDTSLYDELRSNLLHSNSLHSNSRHSNSLHNKPNPPLPPEQQQPLPLPQDLNLTLKSKPLDDNSVADSFAGLERMFDNWDAADNEWLFSLQTECARPGAVCECGDSCCCPGCFTHTNNPGDTGVYNTILNKMGTILETEKTEGEGPSKPCHSSLGAVERSPDAKL